MNHICRDGAGTSAAHSELPKHKGRGTRWSLIRQKVDLRRAKPSWTSQAAMPSAITAGRSFSRIQIKKDIT